MNAAAHSRFYDDALKQFTFYLLTYLHVLAGIKWMCNIYEQTERNSNQQLWQETFIDVKEARSLL